MAAFNYIAGTSRNWDTPLGEIENSHFPSPPSSSSRKSHVRAAGRAPTTIFYCLWCWKAASAWDLAVQLNFLPLSNLRWIDQIYWCVSACWASLLRRASLPPAIACDARSKTEVCLFIPYPWLSAWSRPWFLLSKLRAQVFFYGPSAVIPHTSVRVTCAVSTIPRLEWTAKV